MFHGEIYFVQTGFSGDPVSIQKRPKLVVAVAAFARIGRRQSTGLARHALEFAENPNTRRSATARQRVANDTTGGGGTSPPPVAVPLLLFATAIL